eukprot:TRINITY_DN1604_c0_g1_i8.p1 TRINITY_DN1604_c0_g1~~TRINITY_DN1604_c0_g1_i8.p1  ORF type:complete len:247 (+),score=-11.76 TRINITY_DN1604_c0_g1_i8:642-1382(+)
MFNVSKHFQVYANLPHDQKFIKQNYPSIQGKIIKFIWTIFKLKTSSKNSCISKCVSVLFEVHFKKLRKSNKLKCVISITTSYKLRVLLVIQTKKCHKNLVYNQVFKVESFLIIQSKNLLIEKSGAIRKVIFNQMSFQSDEHFDQMSLNEKIVISKNLENKIKTVTNNFSLQPFAMKIFFHPRLHKSQVCQIDKTRGVFYNTKDQQHLIKLRYDKIQSKMSTFPTFHQIESKLARSHVQYYFGHCNV